MQDAQPMTELIATPTGTRHVEPLSLGALPPALPTSVLPPPDRITQIGRCGVALLALVIWCVFGFPVWVFLILRTMPAVAVRLVMDLYGGAGTRTVCRIDQIVQIWPRGFLALLRIARGQQEPDFNFKPHGTPLQALIDTGLAIVFYASLTFTVLHGHHIVGALLAACN